MSVVFRMQEGKVLLRETVIGIGDITMRNSGKDKLINGTE